ncbi:MAG: tetratricopeptide repeat protein [Myxococcota bacterium]
MTRFIAMVVFFAALGSGRPVARAWDPLRRPAPDVQEGNAALRAGDAERALAAYDRAARRLPDAPGVQLNRGLALLARGDLPGARDALLAATDPGAAPDIRADAYADLGLAFFREADAMAEAEDHQQSQQLFREAVDAFRRSLRVRPGDRNTAWNLELAARRLREEREKQEQQEQQEQEQQEQQQEQQEQEQEQEQDPQEQDPGRDAGNGRRHTVFSQR